MFLRLFILLSLLVSGSFGLYAQNFRAQDLRLSLSKEEMRQNEKELNEAAKMAIDYFSKNPKELSYIVDASDFRLLRSAFQRGQVSALLDRLEPPKFRLQDNNRGADVYKFNHPIIGLLDYGHSLNMENQRENLYQTYKTVYEGIPSKYRRNLADPRTLQRASVSRLQSAVRGLDSFITKYFDIIIDERLFAPAPKPNPMSTSTSNESGFVSHSSNTVDDGARQCDPDDYHPQGIVNKTQIAKDRLLTSIKNQSRRGTCVAFAYAASFESEKLRHGRGAQNISEQALYAYAKIILGGVNKKDGLRTGSVAGRLLDHNYVFSPENTWIYNRSRHRDYDDFVDGNYSDSCVNYPSLCSDQSSQSVQRDDGVWRVRGLTSGPTLNSSTSLMTISKTLTMYRLIMADRPAVVAIQTDRLFRNSTAESDGYIRLDRHWGENRKGGHAMMYVGFVPNQALPDGVDNASGPGYLVFKNSYGLNRHDCGFYYLDFNYVRDRITSALTLNL